MRSCAVGTQHPGSQRVGIYLRVTENELVAAGEVLTAEWARVLLACGKRDSPWPWRFPAGGWAAWVKGPGLVRRCRRALVTVKPRRGSRVGVRSPSPGWLIRRTPRLGCLRKLCLLGR